MARRAFACIRTLGELAVVRVFVAVGALGKRDRFFKVSAGVALGAIDRSMLAFKRELRLGVIEMRAHCLQRDLLPTAGAVAGGTTLRETAVVRIFVAIRALIERNSSVLRLAIRTVDVALRALYLHVHPC